MPVTGVRQVRPRRGRAAAPGAPGGRLVEDDEVRGGQRFPVDAGDGDVPERVAQVAGHADVLRGDGEGAGVGAQPGRRRPAGQVGGLLEDFVAGGRAGASGGQQFQAERSRVEAVGNSFG